MEKKPVNVYAAYQEMLRRSKLKQDEILKKPLSPKPSKKVPYQDEPAEVMILGQGGAATTNVVRKPGSDGVKWPLRDKIATVSEVESDEHPGRHPNEQYASGSLVSPFYKEDGKLRPESGIFSSDEGAVLAAIDKGVPTNKPVNSRLIPMGTPAIGLFEGREANIGSVDALVWQCWLGNDRNVVNILKAGYKPQSKYNGYNPITAAVMSSNIQVLKDILHYGPIAKMVNDKDGFGTRPLQAAASIPGIDPYEFAREIVKAGGTDRDNKNGEFSALMLTLMRRGAGAIWTPNIFSEILPVSDLEYKANGLTVEELAEKLGNNEAVIMLEYYRKFGKESLNKSIIGNGMEI